MMMHSLVLVIFLLFCTSFCPARQWNSHEIAVGEWDVTLRGGWWFNPSHIFPHNSTGERSTCILSSKKWRPWGSTFDCSLSVCADGTFVLTPVAKNHHHHHHRLPLCGQWKVLSNPYCITDRFYDQLVLESYPRVETKQHNHIPLQSVELAMSCRMWGKYASNKRFLFQRSWRRPRGRMTHGTLLVSKRAIPNRKMQRWGRPILASFSAFRSNDIPNHDGWEDEAYFGY